MSYSSLQATAREEEEEEWWPAVSTFMAARIVTLHSVFTILSLPSFPLANEREKRSPIARSCLYSPPRTHLQCTLQKDFTAKKVRNFSALPFLSLFLSFSPVFSHLPTLIWAWAGTLESPHRHRRASPKIQKIIRPSRVRLRLRGRACVLLVT